MTIDEHQTREVIWGKRIMGGKMRAETAREKARKAARAADRVEANSVGGIGNRSAALPRALLCGLVASALEGSCGRPSQPRALPQKGLALTKFHG